MNRLVSRSLEILGQATKDIGQDYTSNLTSFINDAKDVKNSIVKSTTDASDTFARLKATNITKKISDWFYQEENAHDSSLGDEFDPGFKIDSNDDKKLDGEQSSSSLTLESMTNITEKQTGTMIKIGRRQAEQSIANTAEIVSVVNNRTSEMIASMNNINKTLIGISDRLDKLIKLQTVEIEESKYEEKSGIYDSNGNLSLKRIFDQTKQNAASNSAIQTASMFAQMLTGGGGPVDVAKFLMGFGTQKKLDVLGGKSIDSIGKEFNESIGTAIQTALDKAIRSDGFKKFFGDLTKFEGNTDYGAIAANTYNTKKALFDGMTRMSIVNIIPEYLNKINEALTGESYHVDSRGRLIKGPVQNKFSEVTKSAFSSSGLTDTAHKNILSNTKKTLGSKVNDADITMASQALTGAIVMYCHEHGTTFGPSDLKKDMTPFIMNAVRTLCNINNDPEYWANICQSIVIQLNSGMMDSSKFTQNINSSLRSMMGAAVSFAKSGKPEAAQAGKLTYDMFESQFVDANKSKITTPTPTPATQPKTDDASVKVTRDDKYYLDGKHTQGDFIRGIFGILNRGINVKVLSTKNPSWKFEDYDLNRTSTKQTNVDNTMGAAFRDALMSGGKDKDVFKNAIKNGMNAAMGGGSDNEGGGGLGFLGNLFSHAGGGLLSSISSKLLEGGISELPNNLKNFFSSAKDKAKELKNSAADYIPGSIKYDKRTIAAKEAVMGEGGYIDQAKGKLSGARDKASEVLNNNGVYRNIKSKVRGAVDYLDDKKVQGARGLVENFTLTPEMVDDVDDRAGVELAFESIRAGKYDDAKKAVSMINNRQIKQALGTHIQALEKIKKAEEKAAGSGTDIADGSRPDIASSVDSAPIGDLQAADAAAEKKSGIIGVVARGFKAVGTALGKLLEFSAKMVKRGLEDITIGLKTMAGGFFGHKVRDENGEVVTDEEGNAVREKGVVPRLLAPMIGVGKLTVKGAKLVGKGIKKGVNAANNITFTGRYDRDENGNIIKDDEGNRQLTNTATVADLIKHPAKTLAKSLTNIATDIRKSKLGEAVKSVAKVISTPFKAVASTLAAGMKGVGDAISKTKLGKLFEKLGNSAKKAINKIKGDGSDDRSLKQKIGDKFRSTKFGAGFMKGFDEAKSKRAAKQKEKARHESYTTETLGDISDVILNPITESGKKNVFTSLFDPLNKIKEGVFKLVGIEEKESADESKDVIPVNNEGENVLQQAGTALATNAAKSTAATEAGAAAATEGALAGAEAGAAAGPAGAAAGAAAGVAGATGGASGALGILGSLGEIFGGFTQVLMGIGETILGIVASLEGLQAIKEAVRSIFEDGLQPLNEAFEGILDALTPFIEALKGAVTSIAESIVVIVKTLLDVIKPIMDCLMEILQPILDIINILVEVIMVPILFTLDFLSPIIEGIGYTMKITSGAVQIGMGIIIGLLGSLLKVAGSILGVLGKVPLVGKPLKKLGKSIESTADNMLDSSKSMISSGVQMMKEGVSGLVALAKSIVAPADEEDTSEVDTSADEPADATLGYDMGAGDVSTNTYNTTNNWTYTYGSGNTTMNQHSYGNYMNMSERGCGPVALADAYNRRNGGNINPRTLASDMMGAGMYEPRRGTSANSMINAGSAMGMNMRLGGVTQSSLKKASPTNPITVLGSGAGFGTKNGNNHYVNVIGTDKNGGAYVSNPMSGRVERQSASNLALNAKLGLYGSGDNEYEQYGFSEETTNLFEKLKNLTSQFTTIFTGSTKDKITKEREENKNKQKAETIRQKLSEEEYKEIQDQAIAKLKEKYPQQDGESNEEYEARINKKFESEGSSLIVQLGGQKYADIMQEFGDEMIKGAEESAEGFEKAKASYGALKSDQIEAEADAEEAFESFQGAIMAPYAPIEYIEPQIDGATSGKSPVHDFFAKTSGANVIDAYTLNGGWFEHTDAPVSKEGVGSQGDPHEGIAISFTKKSSDDGEPEVHAITGGTITYVGTGGKHGEKDPNGGLGNHVKWRDDGGMYHWYLHLADLDSNIKEGANLEPGQLIGHVGDTGDTGERGKTNNQLLRYIVTRMGPYGNTGDDGYVNPLTYWQFQEGGNEELTGGSEKEQIFNYLVNTLGLSKKAAAGIMGVFQAESGLSAGTLEGYYAFDADTVKNATKNNTNMDTYTTGSLFPMYANSGVGINKDAYKGSDGHYYPGFGLAQWTGPRGAKLMAYAKENGVDWTDLASQLGLIKQELTGDYSGLYDDLKSKGKDDVVRAANLWMTQYEAGGSGEDPNTTMLRSLGGISTRQNNAKAIYNEFENHTVSPSSTTSSNSDGSIVGRFISSITNHAGTGDGYFISDGGVAMANYGTPKITSTNITSSTSGNSPVHEFFGAMVNDMTAMSANNNWYGMRQSPDSSGRGSSGGSHGGIDIWWGSGKTEGQELHAITGGVVDISQGGAIDKSSNGRCGNNVRWLDDAGYLHWYMHMMKDPLVKAGDRIEPGQLLGYAGNTGDSDGAHLHYNINRAEGFSGSSGDVNTIQNPLTYFKNYNPSGTSDPNNQGQHRGGFTNAKVQTTYTGPGPYKVENTDIVSPVMGSGDFWYDALMDAQSNVSADVPDIDMSKFDQSDFDTSNGNTQIVNNYEITSDSSGKMAMLDKMSKMTFNVRAERVEELLEQLIEKVSGDKPKPATPNTNGYDPNMFSNNRIPDQVTRLAKG